jgi:apolipoprotein N-acyltransferase
LWLGWPVKPLAFFLFIALIPLLIAQEEIERSNLKRKGWKFFYACFFTFLIWNASTTWWVYNSTSIGAVFAFVANSLFMCVPWLLYHKVRKFSNQNFSYFCLIFFWIGFEYLHLSWELSWPWLTIGNGFAMFPEWVQWYQYTGVLGGTLWVLLVNLLIFRFFISENRFSASRNRKLSYLLPFVILPLIFSYILYYTYEEEGKEIEVVLLQPNIDPYSEKFAGTENFIPYEEQARIFMQLSEKKITQTTDYLVWPETALDNQYTETSLLYYGEIKEIIQFKNKYPKLNLLTGITTLQFYPNKESASETARFHEKVGFYDYFNTALNIHSDGSIKVYHKSKLVPGVEIMPYPSVFKFILGKLIIDLGGTTGGLGRQKERTVFSTKDSLKVAPVICYESIYGDFLANYVRNGAEVFFIITNDGWWGNSPGHKQHVVYGRLRAIEFRKSIGRSANTGISGFINQRGDILAETKYWEQDVISGKIKVNNRQTLYARYGDYIGRIAAFLSPFLLIMALVRNKTKTKPKNNSNATGKAVRESY